MSCHFPRRLDQRTITGRTRTRVSTRPLIDGECSCAPFVDHGYICESVVINAVTYRSWKVSSILGLRGLELSVLKACCTHLAVVCPTHSLSAFPKAAYPVADLLSAAVLSALNSETHQRRVLYLDRQSPVPTRILFDTYSASGPPLFHVLVQGHAESCCSS